MWTRSLFAKFGGVALGLSVGASAQMHHVDKPERVTRAVGVYEWTGDLTKPSASRFVPVSLFIDGHFEDAGVYLARPVPFALESGNLYTVERSGEPEGALDLEEAERVVSGNALADDNPLGAWYGFGKFVAEAAPKAPPPLHKSAHVGVIQSSSDNGKTTASSADTKADADDGRPHMARRTPSGQAGSDSSGDSGNTGKDQGPTSGSGKSSGSDSSGGDDTDRPTLARRDPSQDAARRRTAVSGKKGGTASVTSVGPAPGDDPDRPRLGHNAAADDEPKPLTGMPAGLHQAVAVSDPVSRDPHPFARPWENPAERASTLSTMEGVAKTRIAAYLAENKLVPSTEQVPTTNTPTNQKSTEGIAAATENGAGAPPKLQRGRPTEYGDTAPGATAPAAKSESRPATKTASRSQTARHSAGKTPSKPAPAAPLLLQNEEITGFTLSYGGLPTFVYTASVPAAAAHPGDLPAAATHPTAFVTLVAQRLPSGELQVALSAVTDSLHLDRSPRLHLVDAVDPDASHRASLLFELRGGSSRQFALYRLITARAENTFTSASIE